MSRLRVSLLGTFQVLLDHQPVTHFRSTKIQGLLVYLLLRDEKPLPRELLAALFWPDESESTARNNLRQSLFRLRQLLGDLDESTQPYLLVTRQTVQFNPKSDFALDVQQFLQAVDSGDLATAVSHYHGDLLPGFTCDGLEFEAWLRQERENLHHLAVETMVELTRDCFQKGAYEKAQSMARQQLSLEPWREQAHSQLMQAYALAGDRAAALNQFEVCRTVLQNELGLEPAPETRMLFEDIKAGRFGAAVQLIRPPIKIKHNLPAYTTPLIGRELELGQVSQMLTADGQRLVSILGPGGMGKTRLAVAVGLALLEQFRDGVYIVDLAALAQLDEIAPAIAAALNYKAPDKSQQLFPQLLTALRQKQLLLILDNFEHVLVGAALVNDMLQACPYLAILVTSRQRLGLTGETGYKLGGLDFPDWLTPEDGLAYTAVQLFVENCCRLQPDFALTKSNVAGVGRICQLVQGTPLALLLAASWLTLLSPAEIAAEIETSIDFLAAELVDLPSRHHSMQAVFDYSWQLLTPTEQTVLARLSVFRGGFTREAAEQVTGANLRLLLALVNKSLLQRDEANGRFALHGLLRQFAAQQRRQIDGNDETLMAHCQYFARVVIANAMPVDQLYAWIAKHGADRDNLHRAWTFALENGLAEALLNLIHGIHAFNVRQGIPDSPMIKDAVQALQQHGFSETSTVMRRLWLIAQFVGLGYEDSQEIITQYKNVIPILQKADEVRLLLDVYWGIGFVLEELGDPESIAYFEKVYEMTLELGDEIQIKNAEAYRLTNRVEFGLLDETVGAQLATLLAYFAPEYAKSDISFRILLCLTKMKRLEKAYAQAIEYGQRCLAVGQYWQNVWAISRGLYELGQIYTLMDLPGAAKQQHLAALEWHLAIAQTWQTLGQLYFLALNIPEWIGGQETAVSILSMITHHDEANAYHQQLIGEALPPIRAEMGEAAFAAAWEAGKKMDFDTAVSLIRSALSSQS
ncbi:MAG: AAA family ATPase [Ardenticatenaceae bacterium]|nr:AAA family ATPase [Ardenticatenaceae bacterium]